MYSRPVVTQVDLPVNINLKFKRGNLRFNPVVVVVFHMMQIAFPKQMEDSVLKSPK